MTIKAPLDDSEKLSLKNFMDGTTESVTDQEVRDEVDQAVGERLTSLLFLDTLDNGRVEVGDGYGSKTFIGLARVVRRVIESGESLALELGAERKRHNCPDCDTNENNDLDRSGADNAGDVSDNDYVGTPLAVAAYQVELGRRALAFVRKVAANGPRDDFLTQEALSILESDTMTQERPNSVGHISDI